MLEAFGVSGAVNSEFRLRVPTLIFFCCFYFFRDNSRSGIEKVENKTAVKIQP